MDMLLPYSSGPVCFHIDFLQKKQELQAETRYMNWQETYWFISIMIARPTWGNLILVIRSNYEQN